MIDQGGRRRGFVGNVVTMAGGSGIAQALLALSAPILTRVFSIKAFALYAVFMAVISLLAVGGAGRFEFALVVPSKREDASDLLLGALVVLFMTTGLLSIVCLGLVIWNSSGWGWLDSGFLGWVPAGMLVTSLSFIQTKWLAREGRFSLIAKGEILYVCASVLIQIAVAIFAVAPVLGLIGGYVGGRVVAEGYMGKQILSGIDREALSIRKAWAALGRYRSFPLLSFPQGMISTTAHYLPTLVLSSFGAAVVGAYALARRTVAAPMTLIGNAVAQVFFPRITKARYRPEEARSLLVAVYVALFVFIAPFALALMLFGEPIFRLVFGTEWGRAGEVAGLLVPIMVVRFVVAPPSLMMQSFDRQGLLLVWTIVATALGAAGLAYGVVQEDWRLGLQLFSWLGAAMYTVFLVLSLRILDPGESGKGASLLSDVSAGFGRLIGYVRPALRIMGARRVLEFFLRVRYPRGRIVVLGRHRFRVACYRLDDHRAVKRFPSYEGAFVHEFLEAMLHARVVFDVGANIGLYTLAAAAVNPTVEIHAFEPEESVRSSLKRSIKVNGFRNIHVHDIAVGASDGMISLRRKGRSGHFISDTENLPKGDHGVRVRVQSLASLVAEQEVPFPDLVKIDVEGYEHAVIKGLIPAMEFASSPVFFVEVHEQLMSRYGTSSEDLKNDLLRFGYQMEVIRQGGEASRHSQQHVVFRPLERNLSKT